MTVLARHISSLCLLGVASLVICADVRAESPEAKKRAFAELLARRARAERVEETRDHHGAASHHLARVSSPVTSVSATPNAFGIPPASPVSPATGFGFGRDAFVDAFFLHCSVALRPRRTPLSGTSSW